MWNNNKLNSIHMCLIIYWTMYQLVNIFTTKFRYILLFVEHFYIRLYNDKFPNWSQIIMLNPFEMGESIFSSNCFIDICSSYYILGFREWHIVTLNNCSIVTLKRFPWRKVTMYIWYTIIYFKHQCKDIFLFRLKTKNALSC